MYHNEFLVGKKSKDIMVMFLFYMLLNYTLAVAVCPIHLKKMTQNFKSC